VLAQKGHDNSVLRAKNISEFQGEGAPKFDFLFTVCNQAANEECPAWTGQMVSARWGVPDPVKAEGTYAQKPDLSSGLRRVLSKELSLRVECTPPTLPTWKNATLSSTSKPAGKSSAWR
jgi:protein-tyrosine-phosphatase